MTKLLCLDFDGVIVESSAIKVELFCQAANEQDPSLGAVLYKEMLDGELVGSSRYTISHWLQYYKPGFNAEIFLKRFALLLDQVTFLKVRQNFHQFLDYCHKQHMTITIVSSAPSSDIKHILNLNGIDLSLFEGIYGSDCGDKYEIVSELLEKTNLTAEESLFIGDLPSDHRVAISFQMPFIRFESMIGKQSQDPAFQSTILVKSFQELQERL